MYKLWSVLYSWEIYEEKGRYYTGANNSRRYRDRGLCHCSTGILLSMEVGKDSKSVLVKNFTSYFPWTHLLEKLYLDNMETITDSQRKLRT